MSNASKKRNDACECHRCRGRLTSLAFACISKTPRKAPTPSTVTEQYNPMSYEVASRTAPSLLPNQAGSPDFDLRANAFKPSGALDLGIVVPDPATADMQCWDTTLADGSGDLLVVP